jgi:cytochrome c peroxidase
MRLIYNKVLIVFLVSAVLITAYTTDKPRLYTLKYDEKKFSPPVIPESNLNTYEGIQLGRLLFYDPILSGNNKQSCADCHIQQYSFTDGKKFALGSDGSIVPKNTMSLTNLAWGNSFFWDGRVNSLESLIKHPVTDTAEMNQKETELINELKQHSYYPVLFQKAFPDEQISMITISKAISQFIRIIISDGLSLPDSLNLTTYGFNESDKDNYETLLKENSFRGMYLRLGIMCTPCHSSETFGGEKMANNLLDRNQTKLFKAPTMINILLTSPYMHDGRFDSANEVLNHYNNVIDKLHLVNQHLSLKPIPNLIIEFDRKNFTNFLSLFTDSSILINNELSNPFKMENFNWDSLTVR